jgi:hypothetical protein
MRLELPHGLAREPERRVAEKPLAPAALDSRLDELRRQRENPLAVKTTSISRQRVPEQKIARDARTLSCEPRLPRNRIPQQAIGLSLREEEIRSLGEIGRFRVLATRDLAEFVYKNHGNQLARDLRFLAERGLVQVESVNARRDGRGGRVQHIEVVTLTRAGRDLARRVAGLAGDQKLYSGLVKPREVEHDTQIYRAYLKEAERIRQSGGSNLRVRLDFELKAQIQKAIYAERKAAPERDINEIKQQVAQQVDLPFVNGGIQIPDARIDYDLDQGSQSGHSDIEVVTAAYRPGHLQNKAQAGFHVYASSSDRSTLTARAENEHHLLDNILEL